MIKNIILKRGMPVLGMQMIMIALFSHSIRAFSSDAGYPPSIFVLPFYFINPFFAVVWQIGVIYFFSDVPFQQYYEMYRIIRQGRLRWAVRKQIYLAGSSLLLVAGEFMLSVLFLVPAGIDRTADWGKLLYTLAMTNASAEYHCYATFLYKFMVLHTPFQAMAQLAAVSVLLTLLTGELMSVMSIQFGREWGTGIVTALTLFVVMERNMARGMPWVLYVSPFSWLNLNRIGAESQGQVPWLYVTVSLLAALLLLFGLWILLVGRNDLHWRKEE